MPHSWQDCRPALRATEPEVQEALRAAAQRVWATVSLGDRRAWHSVVCLRGVNPVNQVTVDRIQSSIFDQARADQQRHAAHAGQLLEFMDRSGIKTFQPEAGTKVNTVVMRVADSMKLGEDPPPWLALRRVIVACTACGENCWMDPESIKPAEPIPTCLRCFDPETDAAVKQMIEEARTRNHTK